MTGAFPSPELPAWTLVEIPHVNEGHGSLCFTEANGHVPFMIERVYWIHDIPPDAQRGRHAHRNVQELLVAVAGEFDVHCDDGLRRDTVHLSEPTRGLFLTAGVWRELDTFTADAVCLVLASGPYDEHEYVREYSAFAARAEDASSPAPRPAAIDDGHGAESNEGAHLGFEKR